MTHTLNDCGCTAKVYNDGSGVDIEFCDMHLNAPARAEAAEAERDEWKRKAAQLHEDVMNGGAAYVAKCYTVTELQSINGELLVERDEARRQLTEAQRAIDVLSQTVIAQNNEIKRLRQKREDVEQYRAEIARLNQAMTA